MKKIIFLLARMPFVGIAQDTKSEISKDEVQNIYDSLPKENGKIQWSEVIKLDSSYTKNVLIENAKNFFSRVLTSSRDITYSNGKKDNKISGIGTFTIHGGSQNTLFARVNEKRDVDFNIEVSFRDGEYSYIIFDITSMKQRVYTYNANMNQNYEVEAITLEKAFSLCSKSSSKKMERRMFYQTIEKLKDIIEQLKSMMARKPQSKDFR